MMHIRTEIVKFHNTVKDILPYNDYVMDVFVDIMTEDKASKKREMKVFIIEINPFGAGSSSGSALFEWKTDYDLLYGQNIQNKALLPIVRVARHN